MLSLDIFGFRALWSPYFLIILILFSIAYYLVTVKFRKRFKHSEPLTKRQAVLFTIAMVLLYATKGSPLDLMGHLMFYTHMIQMAFLYLVIPALFILGIPQWIWKAILGIKIIKPLFSFFTKPLIALILFNGIFSFYHIPLIFDFIKQSMMLHASYTFLLFVLAIFMWWPLMNEVKGYQSLSGLKKVGYIFANGILLTPACALIIFADVPMYETFSDPRAWGEALKLCVPPSLLAGLDLSGPEMFNSMSLIQDQQLGGIVMKIMQEIIYGVILAQVFFSWFRQEQETENDLTKGNMTPNLVK